MPEVPAIALLSHDLMFSSTVGGAAAASGAKLHVVSSLGEVTKLAASHPLKLVIVDLATPSIDMASVMAQTQQLTPPPTVIAYGPHVHGDKLDEARAAGCHEVLTRGQFHSQMQSVIARHLRK